MIETISAEIPYTLPTDEKLVNESFGPKNIHGRRTGTIERRKMEVRNGRLLANQLSLEDQGLVFVEHETKVKDFFDEGEDNLLPGDRRIDPARVGCVAGGDLRSCIALWGRSRARGKTHSQSGSPGP